jgi:hypothetical protein
LPARVANIFRTRKPELNRPTSSSIQLVVTGKGLLKRIGLTLLLTAGLFIFLGAIEADATPIRPNIRKLVTENQTPPPQAVPARAGWDGPEIPRREARLNPDLDPAVTLRSNKAALITAAVPDPRAVLALIVVIFLMRMLRKIQEKQRQGAPANIVPLAPKERIAA